MKSKFLHCALLSFATSVCFLAAHAEQFEQYPVKIYEGPFKTPKDTHKDSDGVWRDALDKLVEPPGVNFAGEYFLAAHSCGTSCRYYQLTNLRTGNEIKQISIFDAGDPLPRTRDGHSYIPILFSKPDSKLLVVQYEIDPNAPRKGRCRQRYFIFDRGRLTAISNTFTSCTRELRE